MKFIHYEEMNSPAVVDDGDYDADSDATYCSEAEIKINLKAEYARTSENSYIKPNMTIKNKEMFMKRGIEENDQKKSNPKSQFKPQDMCSLSRKGTTAEVLQHKHCQRYIGSNTKSYKSIQKFKLLEQHRLKMKKHGKALTSRLFAIRNTVIMWLRGCGATLNKVQGIALFEEVKAIRNILSQLFDASRRLTKHIGGKLPLTHARYSAADQACEALLVQLNPDTLDIDVCPTIEISDSEEDWLCTQDESSVDNVNNESTIFNGNLGMKNNIEKGKNLIIKRNISTKKSVRFLGAIPTRTRSSVNTGNKILKSGEDVQFDEIHDLTKVTGNTTRKDRIIIQDKGAINEPQESDTRINLKNSTAPTLNKYTFKKSTKQFYDNVHDNDPRPNICEPEFNQNCSISSDRLNTINACITTDSFNSKQISMDANQPLINHLHSMQKENISENRPTNINKPANTKDNDEYPTEADEMQYQDLHVLSQTTYFSQSTTCDSENHESTNISMKLKDVGTNTLTIISESSDTNKNDLTVDPFSSDDDQVIESSLQSIRLTDKVTNNKKSCHQIIENSGLLPSLTKLHEVSSERETLSNKQESTKNSSNADLTPSNEITVPTWCDIFEQHKNKNTLPTLIELMLAGMLHPGEMALTLKESDVKASLLKNGKIRTFEGATFQSPMAWCSAWYDGRSISKNMAYQRVYYNGISLMDVCRKAFDMALEKIASAKEQEECHKKKSCQTLTLNFLTNDIDSQINNITLEDGKEVFKDPILEIRSVLLHTSDEFQLDENYTSSFWNDKEFPVETKYIDLW